MKDSYDILYPMISHFAIEKIKTYKDFSKKEITGVYLSVTSFVRKNYSLQRIETLIRKHNLPLVIDEKDLENTSQFKIKSV